MKKQIAKFYLSLYAADWLSTPCLPQKTRAFFFVQGKTEGLWSEGHQSQLNVEYCTKHGRMWVCEA